MQALTLATVELPLAIGRPLDYLVPPDLDVVVNSVVEVAVGVRPYAGVVTALTPFDASDTREGSAFKPVRRVLCAALPVPLLTRLLGRRLLIPDENVKDLAEIPDNIKGNLDIKPVKWIDEVFELALQQTPRPTRTEVVVTPETPMMALPSVWGLNRPHDWFHEMSTGASVVRWSTWTRHPLDSAQTAPTTPNGTLTQNTARQCHSERMPPITRSTFSCSARRRAHS